MEKGCAWCKVLFFVDDSEERFIYYCSDNCVSESNLEGR